MSLRVVIADDERWMRDSIEKSIPWTDHGLRVVGKAANGQDALEMIIDLTPEIVLADIRMPGIDGIALLRKIRDLEIDCSFIFISGYDSFDYAQEALNLGAVGYVLKPVDEVQLLQLLWKAKSHIRNPEPYEELSRRDVSDGDSGGLMSLIGDRFPVDGTAAGLCVEVERNRIGATTNSGNLSEAIPYLRSVCDEQLNSLAARSYTLGSESGLHLLIVVSSGLSDTTSFLQNRCTRILQSFLEQTGFQATITIGPRVREFGRIKESFECARTGMKNRSIRDGGTVIVIERPDVTSSADEILDSDLEQELVGSFDNLDKKAFDIIRDKIDVMQAEATLTADALHRFDDALVDLVSKIVHEPVEKITSSWLVNWEEVRFSPDMQSVGAHLDLYQDLVETAHSALSMRYANFSSRLAASVKEFVRAQYWKDIGLDTIAEHFSRHPNYIGRIFKEEYDQSVVQYLTTYRISVAKQKFRKNPDFSISEIARMVGFNDAKYFSRIFRRVVGMTPSQYIGKRR